MACWAVLLAVAVVLVASDWPGFPWDEAEEARVKGLCTLLVVALLVGDLLAGADLRGRATWRAIVAALLAVAAYFNFGLYHGDRFHHDWEQFHYALSAKYFPELGYDGLYWASVSAQSSAPTPGRVVHRVVRDLDTNEVVPALGEDALSAQRRVRDRFSETRWRDFVDDHRHFVEHTTSSKLASIRLDHGFNAPPSWLAAARVAVGSRALDGPALDRLGVLDVALVAVALGAVVWAFGSASACWVAALFGLSYLGRFFWVGGSLLRLDWFAAVAVSICLAEKRRPMLAGLALGYAASVRLFPLLFALGPVACWCARGALRRAGEPRRELLRFVAGLGVAGLMALGAGVAAGGGADAWTDFAEVISLHRGTWLTNNVGLDNLLLHDSDTLGRDLVDFSRDEPWTRWQERLDANRAERRLPALAVKLALLALFVAAMRRRSPSSALALGQFPVFVVFLTTCYYWQMLALLPLAGRRALALGALGCSLVLWGAHLQLEGFETRYALASLLVGVLLCADLIGGLVVSRRRSS